MRRRLDTGHVFIISTIPQLALFMDEVMGIFYGPQEENALDLNCNSLISLIFLRFCMQKACAFIYSAFLCG